MSHSQTQCGQKLILSPENGTGGRERARIPVRGQHSWYPVDTKSPAPSYITETDSGKKTYQTGIRRLPGSTSSTPISTVERLSADRRFRAWAYDVVICKSAYPRLRNGSWPQDASGHTPGFRDAMDTPLKGRHGQRYSTRASSADRGFYRVRKIGRSSLKGQFRSRKDGLLPF